MNKKLARITSAKLEIKERGILNFWLDVDYDDGFSQGIGGIALDTWNSDLNERVGTAYGCEMIRQILLCFNVNDFSEMKGKDIWVLVEGDGLNITPVGIQALRADGGKQVIFEDVRKMFVYELEGQQDKLEYLQKWIPLKATRQYRHNDDNSPDVFNPKDGFVIAYDKEEVDRLLDKVLGGDV